MENRLNIENLTNGMLTFQKLKQLYSQDTRKEGDSADYVRLDRLSLLQETLNSITGFFPETRGGSFSSAFKQGSQYSSAYRNLKQQLRTMNVRSMDSAKLINTMKLVVPMLNNKQRVYMSKVVKIFEILQS